MYTSFYGLKEKPFDLHPDPDCLFMSSVHDNAYSHLEYAMAENKGFVVITGEIGSGKTTLLNYFLNKFEQDSVAALVNNTSASNHDFTRMICQEFEIDVHGFDKLDLLFHLHDFLIQQFEKKVRVLLVIDEAQNLTPEAIEEIRLISNLETEKHYLIQIILVGQPELKRNLQSERLRQFTQRVTVHYHLEGLGEDETDQYIRYRLKTAGAEDDGIFNKDAVRAIHEYTKGIPRLINIICDSALVYGYAGNRKKIDGASITAVIKERKASGIFQTDAQDSRHYEDSNSPEIRNGHGDAGTAALVGVAAKLTEQLTSLRQEISMLEGKVGDLDRKTADSDVGRKVEQDAIVQQRHDRAKDILENGLNALRRFYLHIKGLIPSKK